MKYNAERVMEQNNGHPMNIGMDAVARMPRGVISLEVEGLKSELSALESYIEQLRNMIDPILNPSTPHANNDVETRGAMSSPVADTLRNIRKRAQVQSGIIDDIISRLDL